MGLSRAIRVAAVLAGGGIALTQACSLVTSYEGFTGDPSVTCGQRIPAAPGGGDGADLGALIGAMKTIRFSQTPGTSPLGYDLDELCTKAACKSLGGQPKTMFGVDNVVGQFLGQLYQDAGDGADVARGLYGLVMKLESWNGNNDDPQVKVSLYNVVGVNGSTDGGAVATFGGDDTFIAGQDAKGEYILAENVLASAFADAKAYVTGGVLVAHIAKLRIRYVAPNTGGTTSAIEITLDQAALVGKVARAGTSGLRMDDAQIVGRMLDSELLKDIGQVGVCRNASATDGGPSYTAAKAIACPILDLPANQASDGKNLPCSAASFAIGVTFAAGKLSPTLAPAALGPDLCGNPSDTCP